MMAEEMTQFERIEIFQKDLQDYVAEVVREDEQDMIMFHKHLDRLCETQIKALPMEERNMNFMDWMALQEEQSAHAPGASTSVAAVDAICDVLQQLPPKRKGGRTAKKAVRPPAGVDLENIPEDGTVQTVSRPRRAAAAAADTQTRCSTRKNSRSKQVPATPLNQQMPANRLDQLTTTARRMKRTDKAPRYVLMSESGSPLQASTVGHRTLQLVHKMVQSGEFPPDATMKRLREEFGNFKM